MTASAPPLATWAGTHTFTAPRLIEATSVEQVQDAVRTRSGRVRALGTRHSFNDLADTDGTLISVTAIDPRPVLDESARTVTVGGGTRYGVLAAWLEERGWALHNMGSLPHISVAGATATGTHGSGVTLGNLSTAVRALEFVAADGELRTVTAADPDFAGYVVHLGAIGIVTRLTLAIEPSYQVRQDIYAGLPWEELLGDLEGVMSSGYSVGVFTHWTTPVVETVLRKTRLGLGTDPDLPARWRGAEAAERLTIIDTDGWTDAGGVAGPWLLRLPHFRLDRTPSAGDEIQSEYFVDRRQGADALRAVRELGARIDPHLILSELRSMAADDLWLSGAEGRETLAIHFTWKPHPDAVAGLLPDIERALAPFAARPHWGKWHRFDAERIDAVFPRAADARNLFERVDPEGVFRSRHLERLGLTPPPVE
ncbi:MAG TPA: FAD-binding protein [Pseudolysinimonas sp.]|jgi:xylitol oxidase|nr:FAD-binding protein [Pseudolysinimonas sp.]